MSPGTIFFNKPPTFWEQYGYFILGTIVCFILLALFFQYRISHLNKLKKIQQKEIDTMTSYKNLINNMPILYMQEELIMNEEGTPIELVYRNVNAHFEKSFFRKEDVVGKKASEIFLNPCRSSCISPKCHLRKTRLSLSPIISNR